MKALFLGHFAATVAPRILAKVKTPLESSILDDERDAEHLAPLLANAEIVVGHIWRPSFPPAPRLRLLQSVAAGLDLLDTKAVPKGVTICNVFGHDPAIAEYVIMTMLVLTHRLFEAVTAFRAGSWVVPPSPIRTKRSRQSRLAANWVCDTSWKGASVGPETRFGLMHNS